MSKKKYQGLARP